jgi:small subunit ribosomal protein SAe
LQLDQETAQLLLAAQCHLGTKNCETSMTGYVYGRRPDGI